MSTTSGGNTATHMQDDSVTTVYSGDKSSAAAADRRVSPLPSSNGDSGLDNSNTESSAGDAKLVIDVPDFSRDMETPRAGIDNPSFETDKTDVPKTQVNGHNGTVNQENGKLEKDKMAEAVNLELINLKPFAKNANGNGNGVPAKKKETSVNMNDTYDDYFIPVNEHKKYIRGGEKLYVTKDKRDMNHSRKPFMCWVFGLILLAAACVFGILASTGIIFNNETSVESRNFMEGEKIAGFGGNHPVIFSSTSPSPIADDSAPFSPPTTDMSEVYVPRAVQGEIVIDNMEFTPDLENKTSPEFKTLASSIENELKKVIFNEQVLIDTSDTIHLKVFEFAPGSVVARYRVGWEYKDDSKTQDIFDPTTLTARLNNYLQENHQFLYNYRITMYRIRSERIMDKCKTNNGKCSHFCSYDYKQLDFVCLCPSELILSENMKDCQRIPDKNDGMEEFSFFNSEDDHKQNNEDDNSDSKSNFDAFLDLESSSEPKSESESEVQAEPEPNSEPEAKAEPEPNSEPEAKSEPEPSSEPEAKAEPEPSSEPEAKAEPEPETKPATEPSSEPEVKAEPEPSSQTEVKVEPEPSSEPEIKAEPEPSSEPETKPAPEPSSEPEVKAEPEPSSQTEVKITPGSSSESEAKAEPEPSSEPSPKLTPEPNSEPEVKAEPEPSSQPQVEVVPEPSSEPEVKAKPEPNSELKTKSVPEPSPEPEVKAEPEPSSELEAKAEPEPSSEPEVKAEPEPNSKSEIKAEPEPSSEPEVKHASVSDVKAEPEPEPKSELISKSSTTESFDSLSDVDISSEVDANEKNAKSLKMSSTEKSMLDSDQTGREPKSHADEVFNHEIKPEATYAVSTESEFESKTESVPKERSKPKPSTLDEVTLDESEGSTTLATITENWSATTLSSVRSAPKLPSDFEVSEKENSSIDEEMKTEANIPSGVGQVESENKSTTDVPSGFQNKSQSEQVTEWPEKLTPNHAKDVADMAATLVTDTSSASGDVVSSIKEFENVSTELSDVITIPPSTELEPIKMQHSLVDTILSEKNTSDDLSISGKSDINDFTKKLQSLTSMEEQTTNIPQLDKLTNINTDNSSENSSITDEQESVDQTMTHVEEQNNEDEKTSALDLYQKPEIKKKDKKTSKNPEFYLSESGFTKRNKTKTEKEKENKKNIKADFDDMTSMSLNLGKCEEGQFQCANGTTKDGSYCIEVAGRCDSIKDCTDNSDEYNCAEEACFNNFRCKSGECLQRSLVCNNITDCDDGSDEQSCDTWKCADNERQCTGGGQCLPASYFCDGISHCDDHSDELQCNSTCNGYQCSNGYCISSSLRCNGVNDCSAGEDEQNCGCNADQFKCSTGSECIPKTQVCDNTPQCSDRSDEWRCVQLDGVQLLAKKNGETAMKVCNTDWSDEWSNFVCRSLGYTDTKTTTYRASELSENSVVYLKLKNDSALNSSRSLTDSFESTTSSCDTVEIKCSTEPLCGDFGGKDPLSMEIWPSVVYLHNTKTHKTCTSSLVKRRWLLSSYSCMHSTDESLSADQWEAVASKTRVANESSSTKKSVAKIIGHPGVKFEKFRYFNDTALVELSAPYDLSDEVNIVCLPEKAVDNKQPCVTAGWSYESPGVFKQFSRYLSDPLMQADLCNSTKYFNGFLSEREICVSPREVEASNMEIGSPLMCLAENGLWQLQGMLSYRGGYGRSAKPSLYNAIVDATPWAENTVVASAAGVV